MSSLIAAYTFNEQGIHDYSGSKFHGNSSVGLTYGLTTATRGVGYDAILSGANSFIKASGFTLAGSLTAFTLFLNFKIPALPTTDKVFVENNSSFILTMKGSGLSASVINWTIYDGLGGSNTLASTTILTANTWYTLACVWDGTKMLMYFNGVADAGTTTTTIASMGAGTGGLVLGAPDSGGSTMAITFNCAEFRNIAATAAQASALNAYPGGVLTTVANHNFNTGDLIGDTSVTNTAVVTWVADAQTYYIYPFSNYGAGTYFRYGNVYDTTRQSIMEISNDYDGNGNSQVSVKYPVASIADYLTPSKVQTIDNQGLRNIPFYSPSFITGGGAIDRTVQGGLASSTMTSNLNGGTA